MELEKYQILSKKNLRKICFGDGMPTCAEMKFMISHTSHSSFKILMA